MGGRTITNLHFAYDIESLAGQGFSQFQFKFRLKIASKPQDCPLKSAANVCLVEHIIIVPVLGGWNVGRFLSQLSFLQAISAVMLWPIPVQKVPQASEYLCPVKLQTRCDICCVCQSVCPFIHSSLVTRWAEDAFRSHTDTIFSPAYIATVHFCSTKNEWLSRSSCHNSTFFLTTTTITTMCPRSAKQQQQQQRFCF